VKIVARCTTVNGTVRWTVGKAGSTHGCRVTTTSFPGGKTGTGRWLLKAMDARGKKNHQQQRKDEMDEELTEIRARMEELALRMQQDAKPHWVYEWPMKRKVKWPVQVFVGQRQ
jgi:hypothetical protein